MIAELPGIAAPAEPRRSAEQLATFARAVLLGAAAAPLRDQPNAVQAEVRYIAEAEGCCLISAALRVARLNRGDPFSETHKGERA